MPRQDIDPTKDQPTGRPPGPPNYYRNNSELEESLFRIQKDHYDRAFVYSIGTSSEKNPLLVIAIADHSPEYHIPGRPEIKLVANIHGDEPVGRELVLELARYILESPDAKSRLLLRSARVHLLPSMNPDGFAAATEGQCKSGARGRRNANDHDLNRNFPDFEMDTNMDEDTIQPETKAVMDWMTNIPFVLSGSLHGGALVANYPFESFRGPARRLIYNQLMHDTSDYSDPLKPILSEYSPTPDNDVFTRVAKSYVEPHPTMVFGCLSEDGSSWTRFEDGITNGHEWYAISGGMQDYNYLYAGCLELTLEVSCCKYPPGEELPNFWYENKESMLNYLLQINQGVRGFILDRDGKGVQATLYVEGRSYAKFHSTSIGEFWRLLLPGKYILMIELSPDDVIRVPFFIPKQSRLSVYNIVIDRNRNPHHHHHPMRHNDQLTSTKSRSPHKVLNYFPKVRLKDRIFSPEKQLFSTSPMPVFSENTTYENLVAASNGNNILEVNPRTIYNETFSFSPLATQSTLPSSTSTPYPTKLGSTIETWAVGSELQTTDSPYTSTQSTTYSPVPEESDYNNLGSYSKLANLSVIQFSTNGPSNYGRRLPPISWDTDFEPRRRPASHRPFPKSPFTLLPVPSFKMPRPTRPGYAPPRRGAFDPSRPRITIFDLNRGHHDIISFKHGPRKSGGGSGEAASKNRYPIAKSGRNFSIQGPRLREVRIEDRISEFPNTKDIYEEKSRYYKSWVRYRLYNTALCHHCRNKFLFIISMLCFIFLLRINVE